MPTAWSHSGSLPSDRIPGRPHPPAPKQQQQNKGKGRSPGTPEPPKSSTIRAAEARLDGARGSNGRAKDPKRGCFCQAREHALSNYVAMCRQCGLILCTLNPPYCACPHCAEALLDGREREVLVGRLEGELAEQLAKEAAERQRAIDETRAAEGAFPMLAGSHTAPGVQMGRTGRTPPPQQQPTSTRTVLSLNSATKTVTVSSYSTPPKVVPSRPASRGMDKEEDLGRVPRPPGEVSYVKEQPDPGRPWRNVRVGDVRYVPLPGESTGSQAGKRGGRKKGGERKTAGAGADG